MSNILSSINSHAKHTSEVLKRPFPTQLPFFIRSLLQSVVALLQRLFNTPVRHQPDDGHQHIHPPCYNPHMDERFGIRMKLLGKTRSGKSTALLRLITELVPLNWSHILILDGKRDDLAFTAVFLHCPPYAPNHV